MISDISRILGRFALKKAKQAKEQNDVQSTVEWLRCALREWERECGLLPDETTKEETDETLHQSTNG